MTTPAIVEVLHQGRSRESLQTRFYRALSGSAEDRGDHRVAERLNELLADEQHHLSRLSARLLELGESLTDDRTAPAATDWEGWEEVARAREGEEIAWYERALASGVLDDRTEALFEEILESERKHQEELGGKWMSA
jgi:rubrerythrin